MIILDTNVVSELARREPDARVKAWVRAQPPNDIYVTAVTEAELSYGIAIMPPGRRRSEVTRAVAGVLKDLSRNTLPFDKVAAQAYGDIAARRRARGLPMDKMDCQIAAIAYTKGAHVATRDESDFAHCGIYVINPWED